MQNEINPDWVSAKYEALLVCDKRQLESMKAQYPEDKYEIKVTTLDDGLYACEIKEK